MKERAKSRHAAGQQESFVKGLSFMGPTGGYPCAVDVNNGKLVRIRPLHYDWQYDPKVFKPWKMQARGQTFEPGLKTLISPYALAYKRRVYSPNRVLFPLKRIDWNPHGNRNTENRGKSGYVGVSWDEALDIIVSELKRVRAEYGPEAVLSQGDVHGESKTIHTAHGCVHRFLALLGGYTVQMRNPDSWEGWSWRQACLGYGSCGHNGAFHQSGA